MATISKLERSIKVYKATYDVTDEFFMDNLDIKSRTTWKNLRSGKREFSAKQLHRLAKTLGIGMNELYEILPDANH